MNMTVGNVPVDGQAKQKQNQLANTTRDVSSKRTLARRCRSFLPSNRSVMTTFVCLCILALYYNMKLFSGYLHHRISTVSSATASRGSSTTGSGTQEHDSSVTSGSRPPNFNDNNDNDDDDDEHLDRLIHVGIFGLGHRLCRTTAAWHLAKRLNLTRMKFEWGTCGKEGIHGHDDGPPIFSYLFGHDIFHVPTMSSSSSPSPSPSDTATITTTTTLLNHDQNKSFIPRKQVLVRNDVYGYVPGHTFKTCGLPIHPSHLDGKGPFWDKIHSDVQFYTMLRDRFIFKNHVDKFRHEYLFSNHTVIGLHLRAGNGEQSHFTYAKRYIPNETEFVSNIVQLIQQFALNEMPRKYPDRFGNTSIKQRPYLLFLATDTVSLVPAIQNRTQAFGIPTIVFPQIRVKDNEGVTFTALQGAGVKCLEGWQAMMSDMILLSYSDVLIAARYSTFTQSLPFSLILDRVSQTNEPGPHVCEVSDIGTSMTCLEDFSTWLFRNNKEKSVTVSMSPNTTTTGGSNDGINTTPEQVIHYLDVQFPDIVVPYEFGPVVEFLSQQQRQSHLSSSTEIQIHRYGGRRFNPKYRTGINCHGSGGLVPTWKFQNISLS